MKTLVTIWIVVLTAGAASAAPWDSSNWPSWKYPHHGHERLVEMVNATHERAKAVANYGFDLPWIHKGVYIEAFFQFGFFKQYSSLVVSKSIMAEIIPSYVDSQASLSATSPIPYLTITGVLARAGAPTNWLDSTPFCNLQTTNLGYRYVPNVLSQLVWTVETTYSSSNNTWYGWGADYHTVTAAQAMAEGWYTPNWGSQIAPGQMQYVHPTRINARLDGGQYWYWISPNLATQMPTSTVYFEVGAAAGAVSNFFLIPTPSAISYADGTNVMECITNADRTISWTFGATNIPLPWATNSYSYTRTDGYVLRQSWMLLKWDVPSGFIWGN